MGTSDPSGDSLFGARDEMPDDPAATLSGYYDLTMNAFYTGDLALGRLACDRFRSIHAAESRRIEETRRNQLFYLRPLAEAASGARRVGVDLGPADSFEGPPAVAVVGDQLVVAVLARDGESARHQGRLVRVDANLQPVGTALIDPASWRPAADSGPVDMRLLQRGNAVFAAATFRSGNRWLMQLRPLDPGTLRPGEPEHGDARLPFGWRPWRQLALTQAGVAALPRLGPTVALELDDAGGWPRTLASHAAPRFAEHFVGGTPLLANGDGYVAVVREHASFPGGAPLDLASAPPDRLYPSGLSSIHRFAAFDREFRLTRLSHPFVFDEVGDEACGGLAILGDQLVLAVDRSRRETCLYSLPLAEMDRLQLPVNNLMADALYQWPDQESPPQPPVGYWITDQVNRELWMGESPITFGRSEDLDTEVAYSSLNDDIVDLVLTQIEPIFWLEVGSLLGRSAILTADRCKRFGIDTSILCIDPFTGDVNLWMWEKQRRTDGDWSYLRLEEGTPTIYRRFLANVAHHRHADIITVVPATSTVGMRLLRRMVDEGRLGVLPDVVYLDAAHEAGETHLELVTAWDLLPSGGLLFGDDFDWPGVGDDVVRFASCIQTHPGRSRDCAERLGAEIRGTLVHNGKYWFLFKP